MISLQFFYLCRLHLFLEELTYMIYFQGKLRSTELEKMQLITKQNTISIRLLSQSHAIYSTFSKYCLSGNKSLYNTAPFLLEISKYNIIR